MKRINRIRRPFCKSCRKCKMLFGSQQKAMDYVKQREDKGDYKPIRAYYCRWCQGWHLTSQYDRNDEEKYEEAERKAKSIRQHRRYNRNKLPPVPEVDVSGFTVKINLKSTKFKPKNDRRKH